jgi:transcriptional regulator with XRE-family HTH domain
MGYGSVSNSGTRNVKPPDSDSGILASIHLVQTFAQFFKERLKGRNIRAFAEKTGSSPSSVSKAQNDEAPPPLEHIDAWAKELGLSDDELASFRQLALDRRALAKADIAKSYAELRRKMEAQNAVLSRLVVALSKDPQKLSKETRSLLTDLEKLL